MGEVLGLVNSGKRNPFRKYKQWDVYRFIEEARPKDCSLVGRVIDITNEYVVFGFRNMTNWRLKVVHLRPRDIRAEVIADSETQRRLRIHALMEKYSCVEPIAVSLDTLLKLPDLTYQEEAYLQTLEFNYDNNVKEVQRSLFAAV